MRTNNLRNKPVDRRYLSDKDKSDYNQSGEYGRRASALSRARGRKGQMAYQANRPVNTQGRTPGTGGFDRGISIQQKRLGEYGQSKRSEYSAPKPNNKSGTTSIYNTGGGVKPLPQNRLPDTRI